MIYLDYKSKELHQLEELRVKMINAALSLGMNHPIVLYYSQKLDKQHNVIINQSS